MWELLMDIAAADAPVLVDPRRKRLASLARVLERCAHTGSTYEKALLGAEQPEVDVAAVMMVDVDDVVGCPTALAGD